MSKPTNQQLMEQILNRLQADSKTSATASSKQLAVETNDLVNNARQLNSAFSIPSLNSKILRKK